MDREKLEAASEQGIITKDQVESLLDFLDDENGASSGKNAEEQLRFVRSFGDIFITLGIIFVTVAGSKLDIDPYLNLIPIILLIGTTEWLVRVRRLALPGIALLVATLYFASQLISFSESWHDLPNMVFYTALALLFYMRYKMPFSLLPVAAGLIGIVSMLIGFDIFEYQYTFSIPTLILHGEFDEVVPISWSRKLAEVNSSVILNELKSDHQLLDQTERMWTIIEKFLN